VDGHDVQLDFIFEFFILNSEGTKGLKTFVTVHVEVGMHF